MYDVITIGSATRDIFVRSPSLELIPTEGEPDKIEGCFPMGAKIEIEDLIFETGGGATNAAATFGRLGLRAAVVTAIGADQNGQSVLEALRAEKVSTEMVQKDPREKTAFSIILLSGSGERTVLVFRGASENISARRIPWPKLRAKWFYVSSLGGDLALMGRILDQADKVGAGVAWNPGGKELKAGFAALEPLIRRAGIFNLNVEEAMLLLGAERRDVAALLGRLRGLPKRAAVITDGLNGAYAGEAGHAWHSEVIDVPRVNVTGAGDAFGSGLVAGLMRRDDLRYALAVGTWNATGVVQQMGAKRGLMKKYPAPAAAARVAIGNMRL